MPNDVIPVQRKMTTLDISPQFDSYSKVIIHVDDNTAYEWGTNTGRTLEFDNPFGSLQMCKDVLARLQGYQYQPYEANGTLLDPAAEIGDALNSPLIYGGIYTRSKTFGRLMKADVSAPQDEEVNHEYKYESPEVREFKRETSDLRASLMVTNNAITAEVTRATTAEGTLSSQITAQATQIAAKVSQTGGNNSSFGWTLTANGFSLYSGGTEVMKCNSSGLTVAGNIAGSTGTIGGFTISSSALYTNNMSSMSSTQTTGVHLSGSGIKIGKNFKVDSGGNLTCSNATISGTLTIGGSTITAAQLQQGAMSAYNNGGTWSTGAGYGYNYNYATSASSGQYPSYFKALSLYCNNLYSSENVFVMKDGGYLSLKNHYHSFSVDGNVIKIGLPTNQQGSFNIADTATYRNGVSAAYNNGYSAGYSAGGTVNFSNSKVLSQSQTYGIYARIRVGGANQVGWIPW